MKSGLRFLMAAKRCEIAELAQLARTIVLVHVTARLVHGLQRERGLSNLFLASPTEPDSQALHAQIADCQLMEQALIACFEQLYTATAPGQANPRIGAPLASPSGHGARLFSRVAYVLHGLDALPHLRQRVAHRSWTATQATAAYIKLIAGLLAVVFEAADSASDPEVSRLLVALFNFMQGKELAGQERAAGAALLASGKADTAGQQRLLHLIDSQERCFQVFLDFASPALRQLAQASQDAVNMAELERMRRLVCTAAAAAPLDPAMSPVWFDRCTRRMDDLMAVETQLAQDLMALCQHKMAAAQQDLQGWEQLQPPPAADTPPDATARTMDDSAAQQAMRFFDEQPDPLATGAHALVDTGLSPVTAGHGSPVERSILELVREQSLRLQAMGTELDTVRASLNERKLVERAKGVLMAHRQLSEMDAHKLLRQTAMNQNRRLGDVAEAVLSMADMLPPLR